MAARVLWEHAVRVRISASRHKNEEILLAKFAQEGSGGLGILP